VNSATLGTEGRTVNINEDYEKVMGQEEQVLMSLQLSRHREECVAQVPKSQAVTYSNSEKALLEKENSSSYQTEKRQFSNQVAPQIWLDIVEERLKHWFQSMTPRTEPEPPCGKLLAPMPTFRSQCTLKALSNVELLTGSPKGTPLNKVTQVVLDGCNFVPDVLSLASCSQLCSLDIVNCGLKSLTSLPSSIPLTSLNLQANNLEQVDLKSVGAKVRFLDLSENRLGSIHGLESCANLLHLNITGNRITRLGNLNSCWCLQHLCAERNLLVSCAGLTDLPYLQTLSCARNHLSTPPDLHKSALLTTLCLQQNTLQEAPHLPHHVVLRELKLEDNSMTDISPLCRAWLPLLQTLSLARNCITQLDSLIPFVMLHTLDISNNSIYDLPMLLKGLNGCMELHEISLDGNPVSEEPQIRSHLISVLPGLKSVNSEPLHCGEKESELSDVVTSSEVYKLCKRQLLEQDRMKKEHYSIAGKLKDARNKPQDIKELMDTKVEQCKLFEQLLVRHVKEQEELGRNIVTGLNNRSQSCGIDKLTSATVVLQAAWRGYMARNSFTAKRRAVVRGQAIWRGILARRASQRMMEERRKWIWAATVIQTRYRGYWVRRKLCEVLQHVRHDSGDDSSPEELIDIINMTEEDLLDEDILPLSPQTPTYLPDMNVTTHYGCSASQPEEHNQLNHTSLRGSTATHSGSVSTGVHHQWLEKHEPRCQPSASLSSVTDVCAQRGAQTDEGLRGSRYPSTQAWSEIETQDATGTIPQPHLKSDSPTSVKKHEIAKEWGFKTDEAVHLLMKRARRQKQLRSKAAQRKRMAGVLGNAVYHWQSFPTQLRGWLHFRERERLAEIWMFLVNQVLNNSLPSCTPLRYHQQRFTGGVITRQ
jgi:protein phosphatase 1 regulatory subunit 7